MTFLRALFDIVGSKEVMLYQWLLPWLYQKPLEEALCEDVDANSAGLESEFRNTERSSSLRKIMSQMTLFLCRRAGLLL